MAAPRRRVPARAGLGSRQSLERDRRPGPAAGRRAARRHRGGHGDGRPPRQPASLPRGGSAAGVSRGGGPAVGEAQRPLGPRQARRPGHAGLGVLPPERGRGGQHAARVRRVGVVCSGDGARGWRLDRGGSVGNSSNLKSRYGGGHHRVGDPVGPDAYCRLKCCRGCSSTNTCTNRTNSRTNSRTNRRTNSRIKSLTNSRTDIRSNIFPCHKRSNGLPNTIANDGCTNTSPHDGCTRRPARDQPAGRTLRHPHAVVRLRFAPRAVQQRGPGAAQAERQPGHRRREPVWALRQVGRLERLAARPSGCACPPAHAQCRWVKPGRGQDVD
mmetsp:Transcript_100351/g.284046  ORF Transcript_100351/g.284046 Transcript_100351/m.284046 type:complete len:327 (-) Transcript_100351:302-1282(-)